MTGLAEKPESNVLSVKSTLSQAAHPGAGRDDELQASRRIDWRFLLPNPRLRRSCYIGSPDTRLAQALHRFGESLTVVSPISAFPQFTRRTYFDLIVLDSELPAALSSAASLAAPGSWLYWEIDRRRGRRRLFFRHVKKYIANLDRLGFEEIQANWNRPDFESCLEIIPLNEENLLRRVFARRPAGIAGRLKTVAGRLGFKVGLLPRLAPCVSITARMGTKSKRSG